MNNELYAMEDFCQLSGRLTLDKYKSSYERCAGIIKRYSAIPGFDMSEFYLRLLVCFVTGNSDMHLKNFSFIEREPGCREYVLSSAYDLLPVNVIMPEDTEETALTLNGKKSNLKRKDFLTFADIAGLNNKAATHIIDNVVSRTDEAIRMCRASFLNTTLQDRMVTLIEARSARLV
jgi:serine/threonine-protein kinase HipA